MVKVLHVLGVHIYSHELSYAVKKVVDDCVTVPIRSSRCISATGAHGLVIAKQNPNFNNILKIFYWNLPDGMPLVWMGHLRGYKSMQRCYGPDFFKMVMIESANKPVNHFFCGGKEGVADELKRVAEEKWGNNNVVGTYSPPFRSLTNDEYYSLGKHIVDLDVHFVWIGLSTPKQEIFADALASRINVCYIATVGAAFDFHTERVKQAPKWIQKIGMEWFYRLCMEPRRLFKRYLEIVPKFIIFAIADLFKKQPEFDL